MANAQQTPPVIAWQKSLGGSGDDRASSIQQTLDGGYIVAGFSYSFDGDVTGNHGSYDCWVVKLGSSGTLEWKKSLGGSTVDEAYSIQQTSDGGYIVAGYSQSNSGDVTGNHGSVDYWMVKLDASGTIQWQKSLGGSGFDFAQSIQQTSDGGYIVAGTSNSSDGDVTGNHGRYDCWVVKLGSSGTLEWQKSLGGSGQDYAYSIQQTSDGGYIVAGHSESTDGDVTGNHGNYDYWVVKLSSSGTLEWQKSLGGSGQDLAYFIQQTSDGGYIVGGYSNSSDGDVTGNHGYVDYWVVKLGSSGVIQWQKSLGGSGDDAAYSIQQTSDGGYIVAGSSSSIDGDVTGNHGSADFWVLKLDSSGTKQWQKSLGGSGDDAAESIQQTSDGGYIIAGYSSSNNGDVAGNHGSYDYWIVKLVPYEPHLSAFSSYNLGDLICGTFTPDTVWVHNTGAAPLTIQSGSFLGPDKNEYSIVSPSAFPVIIAAGDSLRLIWQLHATTVNSKLDTLSLVNDDTAHGNNPWRIILTARKDSADIRLQNAAINLGDVDFIQPGWLNSYIDTVFNTGTVPLSLDSMRWISGDTAFQNINYPAGVLVAPNSMYRVAIGFAPPDTGVFRAVYTVYSSPCDRAHSFTITAHVVAPVLKLATDTLSFMRVYDAGVPETLTVRAHNRGTATLLAECTVIGRDSIDFKRISSDSLIIAPGDSALISIRVLASAVGDRKALLQIISNDPWYPRDSLMLRARRDSVGASFPQGIIDAGDVKPTVARRWKIPFTASGTVDDTIVSITRTGDTVFTCTGPAVVHIGALDSLSLRFTPPDTGTYGASFTVHVQPGARAYALSFIGHSTAGTLDLSASALSFGNIYDCTGPVVRTMQAHNIGSAPLSMHNLIVGANVGDFVLQSSDSVALAPGDSTIITLQCAPSVFGDVNAQLIVSTNNQQHLTDTITLGARRDSVNVSLQSASVNMGDVRPGTSADVQTTVTNVGTAADTIRITRISGSTTIVCNDSLGVIAAGNSDSISFTFTAPDTGAYQSAFDIASEPCNRHFTLVVHGRGIRGNFSYPSALSFGVLSTCSTTIDSISVCNNGSASASITRIAITGGDSASFMLVNAPSVPFTITPGACQSFRLNCVPDIQGAGARNATLEITPADSSASLIHVALSAQRDPTSLSSPSALAFGTRDVAAKVDTTFFVQNNGAGDIQITRVTSSRPEFWVRPPVLPATLAPQQSMLLRVQYLVGAGVALDTATISVDSPCVGALKIAMSGEGRWGGACVALSNLTAPADTIRPNVGDRVIVPLMLQQSQGLTGCGIFSYTWTLRYDSTMLIPNQSQYDYPSSIDSSTHSGVYRTVYVHGSRTVSKDTIGMLHFIAALGDADVTQLSSQFAWTDTSNSGNGILKMSTSVPDAYLKLNNVCTQGGARYFIAGPSPTLAQNRPNPFVDQTTFEFDVSEKGRARLLVHDMLGRECGTVLDEELTPGHYVREFSARVLPAGIYVYSLRTATSDLRRTMVIGR